MSFGESMFSTGFNQKTAKKGLFIEGNHGISSRKQCGKTLEDFRRLSTEADPEPLPMGSTGPTYRPAVLWAPHVSLPLLCWFSTALRIASQLFIQVGLIQGLRIDAPAYIYLPAPPSRASMHLILRVEKPKTLIHMSTRIRASNQEKISPQ